MDEPAEIPELLKRIGQSESAALEELHRLMAGRLFGLILIVLKDRTEAEDTLQEVFLKIWKNAGSYQNSLGSPLGWLLTVARNAAYDRFRKRSRQARHLDQLETEMKEDAKNSRVTSGEDKLIGLEKRKSIREALARLGKEQREAIELAFFSGHTQQEVSEKLGIPLGTIKARIRRGMESLKPHLTSLT